MNPMRPIVLALFALTTAVSTAQADTVVVTAARMVDVVAGRVVEHPVVTVTDGRITGVSTGNATIPAGARRIDLGNRTLLPGLIDMHVHLTSDPSLSGYRQFLDGCRGRECPQNARSGIYDRPQCGVG